MNRRGGRERRLPARLERMLRMHFVQHWFNLSDEACEEALLDSTSLRRFVGLDLGRERVPDGRHQGVANEALAACHQQDRRCSYLARERP